MSELRDRLKTLERKTGGPEQPRLILMARTDGTFVQRGSGETFTAAEAADLEARGIAQLVTFRVVYAEGRGNRDDDNPAG